MTTSVCVGREMTHSMLTLLDEMGRRRQLGVLGISCASEARLFVGT